MPIEIFKQIAKIPRQSGREELIAQFLKAQAEQINCECQVDGFNNVLIKKKTSNKRPLILQAHTDMVCVSDEQNFDFNNNGITVIEKDGFLMADKTSLGADNGIGVAMALALLKQDFATNVEVLFTTQEETTMDGAKNFDVSKLSGKHMLSLDGSSKATIDISSASSTNIEFDLGRAKKFKFITNKQDITTNIFELEISGLIGGHSGIDVDKNLGNAFKILIDFLQLVGELSIIDLQAKVKSNELPTYCKVVFATEKSREELSATLNGYFVDIFNSFNAPNLKINLKTVSFINEHAEAYLDTLTILEFLSNLKFGVLETDRAGSVILSSNLYEIDIEKGKIKLHVRANQEDFRQSYISQLERLAQNFGFGVKQTSYLPGFTAKDNGELLNIAINSCQSVFGKKPKLVNVHAGVECGVFMSKIKDLDVCIIGAQIDNMHSTKERVEISSINQTFELLKEIVRNFK